MKSSLKVTALIALVLIIDQALKFWVKTSMYYGEEIQILGLDWALLHFVENNGMAFGISLGGELGKLLLSLFRILAVGFLIYYIRLLIRSGVSFGLLASFALILAGALGNIIDSAFYGLIFSDSYRGEIATFLPEGGGYAKFLHGKVVDMLYFPLIEGHFPDWFPFWAGERFSFFKPVFNIADSAITTGVLSILVFQRSFFSSHVMEEQKTEGDKENALQQDEMNNKETNTESSPANENTTKNTDAE
ncbi:MAG: lipoprotein signal peptidase [Bacteroidetes bacterium]|nr:lipoprotein signal peptidase [Bacteroidota bacterium]